MLNRLQIKKGKSGSRVVTCVVDGRKVEPFIISPEAYKRFPDRLEFERYLERSARSILESTENARQGGRAA